MVLWLVLNSNQGIKYININFIMIFNILIMIRLFLPFEYSFTKNIAFKVVLPSNPLKEYYVDEILLLVWMTGFIFKSYQIVVLYYRLYNNIKRLPYCCSMEPILDKIGIKKKRFVNFKIVKTSELMTPAIFGLFHPTIIIPNNDYTQEELYYIFCHETEHYYQRDLWIKVILEFLCALYWWNPFSKVFRELVSKTIEMRIDSKIIGTMDERQRLEYLSCLLKVAKSHKKSINNLTVAFNGKKANLKQRFYHVLNYQITQKKRLIVVNSILAGIIIFLSLAITLEPYYIKPKDFLDIPVYKLLEKNNEFKQHRTE